MKREIKEIMGFSKMKPDAIYLGNSFVFGHNKSKEFLKLKERIHNILES